jgi:hypothetical protein
LPVVRSASASTLLAADLAQRHRTVSPLDRVQAAERGASRPVPAEARKRLRYCCDSVVDQFESPLQVES